MRNGHHPPTNPFTYGALALDDAFTNRETELRDLVADMENGQDVVLYAPRRYGKSSLVIRASQRALKRDVLVGYCDLMRTTTKERFAAALAKTIYADLESPGEQVVERAANLFRGLRIRPTMEVDPDDLTLRFTFQAGRRPSDIDDTIERLLELPGKIAAERKRRVSIVFDEFQEIVGLDRNFPNLMRVGVPDAAGDRPRLPRQQAARARADLQRQERAFLAQREADGARPDRTREVRAVHPQALRRDREGDHRPRRSTACSGSRRGIPMRRRSSPTPCGSSCRPGTTRSRTTSTPRSSRCCAPSTTTSPGSGTRRRRRNGC